MTHKFTALFLATLLTALNASYCSADVLYNNGSIITHPTGHVSGLGVSQLQSVTLSDATLGFGTGHLSNNAQNFRLMDDFIIPAGETWRLTGADVFGYQTGSGLIGMNAGTLRIWSGNPASGGTLIYGDTSTNVLSSQSLIGYRISERVQAGPTFTDTTRPIWDVLLEMDVILGEGQYWLDWSLTGGFNPNGSVFTPPVTIPGQGVTASGGSALQFNGLTNSFSSSLSHAISNNAIDLPFVLRGVAIPEVSAGAMSCIITILFISVMLGRRTRFDIPHRGCNRPKQSMSGFSAALNSAGCKHNSNSQPRWKAATFSTTRQNSDMMEQV